MKKMVDYIVRDLLTKTEQCDLLDKDNKIVNVIHVKSLLQYVVEELFDKDFSHQQGQDEQYQQRQQQQQEPDQEHQQQQQQEPDPEQQQQQRQQQEAPFLQFCIKHQIVHNVVQKFQLMEMADMYVYYQKY